MARVAAEWGVAVVAMGALALLVTSLVFPIRPEIGLEFDGAPGISEAERLVGVGFWVIVSLFASQPRGRWVSIPMFVR